MKKAIAAIIMLCLLAAMFGGCGLDTNGNMHMRCGSVLCSGYPDGCYIDGNKVWTNQMTVDRINSEAEACKKALVDYADEMDIIAADLTKQGSFDIDFRKHYNGERFNIIDGQNECVDEKSLSPKTIAAIEALENSERFDYFGANADENGELYYSVRFNARTPGYSVDAHRGKDKSHCNSFCQPLDNDWCLSMWPHE